MLPSKKYLLRFEDCVICDDFMYCFSSEINALFSYCISKDDLRYLGSIPGEAINSARLVGKILQYKSKLILIPMRSYYDLIWMYDLLNEEWECIEMSFDGIIPPYEKISYAFIKDDSLFMVGCYYPGIIVLDLMNHSINYHKNILDESDRLYSLTCCEVCNDFLYIPSPNKNFVYIFDTTNQKISSKKVGEDGCSFSGILKIEKGFLLAPYKGTDVVFWDGDDTYMMYSLPDQYSQYSGYLFNGIFKYRNSIVINGLNGIDSLEINGTQYDYFDIIENSFLLAKDFKNGISIKQDYLGEIDLCVNGKETRFHIYIHDYQIEEIIKRTKGVRSQIQFEVESFDLDFFLKMLSL